MDPRSAFKYFENYLLEFEKTEIYEYDTIYWINIEQRKLLHEAPSTPEKGVGNYGFDNQKQEYIVEQGDHIAYRYQVI